MVFQSVNYPIGISRFFMVSLSRFESFIPDGKRLYLNGGQSPHVNVEKNPGYIEPGEPSKSRWISATRKVWKKCRYNGSIMYVHWE